MWLLLLLLPVIFWLTRSEAEESTPYYPPQIIEAGKTITAPADGVLELEHGPAKLVLDTGSVIVLSSQSEIILKSGRVSAHVRPLGIGENFKVRTFNTTAGVRGTRFSVSVIKDVRTIISVSEGHVYAEGLTGKKIELEAGHSASIDGMAEASTYRTPTITQVPGIEKFVAMPPLPPVHEQTRATSTAAPKPVEHQAPSHSQYTSSNSSRAGYDPLAINPNVVPQKNVERTSLEPLPY